MTGHPNFSALQAAISDGKTGSTDLLRFRSAVCRRRRSSPPAAEQRKARLKQLLDARKTEGGIDPLCRTFRGQWRGRARIGQEAVARRHRLQEAERALSLRALRSWTKTKCRAGQEVVLGGWKTTEANSAR